MILPFAGEGQPANTGDHKVSFPAFPQFANNIQAKPCASPCTPRYRSHGGQMRGRTTTPLKTIPILHPRKSASIGGPNSADNFTLLHRELTTQLSELVETTGVNRKL